MVDGRVWRACRTPSGNTTLAISGQERDGAIVAQAWGDGADWALDQLPRLLGDADDWAGFEPRLPLLTEVRRRHPDLRLGRTDLIFESLVPTIIEQKVTGQEAFGGFRAVVRTYGEPAPGPGASLGLMLQPTADRIREIPSWDWLRMHVDQARSSTLVRVAAVSDRFATVNLTEPAALDRMLRAIRGVGVWTSAEVRTRALGDPDAVSFGDYHVAKDVGFVLAGREFDDRELVEFLEPWRPQRGRIPQLLGAAGLHRPRHGARLSPRQHLPSQQ